MPTGAFAFVSACFRSIHGELSDSSVNAPALPDAGVLPGGTLALRRARPGLLVARDAGLIHTTCFAPRCLSRCHRSRPGARHGSHFHSRRSDFANTRGTAAQGADQGPGRRLQDRPGRRKAGGRAARLLRDRIPVRRGEGRIGSTLDVPGRTPERPATGLAAGRVGPGMGHAAHGSADATRHPTGSEAHDLPGSRLSARRSRRSDLPAPSG